MKNSFRLITYGVLMILFLVILMLLYQGGSVISWQFLTKNWSHVNLAQGGIYPAIVGTFWLGLGVMLVSFPVGYLSGLYIVEYVHNSNIKRLLTLAVRNLAGIPSVIYGMFGLAFFVRFLSLGSSLLAAILTLSVMALPWIISSTIEALIVLPQSWREASLSLGATRWQTLWSVIIPASLPTSMTGAIVANARAMGETAPIIMVGATFYLSKLPNSVFDKFMALPYHVFILATQHSSSMATQYAAATALVLVGVSFAMSLIGMGLRIYLRHKLTN